MASGTTLRFTVEVAADQAKQALKAMTLAFNEAGVKANAALSGVGRGAQGATNEISKFKEGVGRARETAMFFTQSLGEFGPAGRTAQMALSGIAGAFIGGGGVLFALSAAQVAVRLLADVWADSSKESEEASKRFQQAAEEHKRRMVEIAEETLKLRLVQSGLTSEQATAAISERKVATEYENSKKKAAELFYEIVNLKLNPYIGSEGRIAEAQKEMAAYERTAVAAAEYLGKVRALAAERAVAEAEAGKKAQEGIANRNLSKVVGDSRAAADNAEADRLRDARAAADARAKIRVEGLKQEIAAEEQAVVDQINLDSFLMKYEDDLRTEAEAKRKRDLDKQVSDYQQLGNTIGTMMGQLATGQMTVGEAFAQAGQMIVQSVVQSAIAQITANASVAGSGAAASQAGIPVIGPILAVSAMGAMISMVLGLLSDLPGRAMGGPVGFGVPYLVGERGPEVFVPGRSGTIIPNHAMGGGGGVTVNITATDAKSVRRLFLENSGSLAEAIGRAVRDGRRFG